MVELKGKVNTAAARSVATEILVHYVILTLILAEYLTVSKLSCLLVDASFVSFSSASL